MSLSTFTVVHVVLSLVGIASGVLVLLRPSASPKAWGLTTLFLATTLAASATGLLYLLLFPRFGMGHGIAIASLAAPLVLMQAAGFPVTAAVVFAGVARAFGSRRPVVDILTGAVLGAVAWFFFNWLGVNLGPFLPLLSER